MPGTTTTLPAMRDAAEGSAATPPLVSVVVPTYNYAHYVLQAISSVQSQDYPAIEIIVVDDGSTDRTPELLAHLPGITYVRQQNCGLPAARNAGMQLASGKYLLFLDADDLLGKSSIRKRVECLECNESLSFVLCRTVLFGQRPGPEWLATFRHRWRLPDPGTVDLALSFLNIAPPHAFLIRRTAIQELGLRFDTAMRACEDYDFWFKLALGTCVPGLVRSCRVFYRQHANSMSRSLDNQARHDAEMCRRILQAFDGNAHWLGHRERVDYLVAMLGGALLVARRLWRCDVALYHSFFRDHVHELIQQLRKTNSQMSASAAPYVAYIRVMAWKMRVRDGSIDDPTLRQLLGALPARRRVVAACLGIASAPGSRVRALTRVLRREVEAVAIACLSPTRMKMR